jgi:hypothetical protein
VRPPLVRAVAHSVQSEGAGDIADLTGGFGVDRIPTGLYIITIAWDNDANKHTFLSDLANGQKTVHLPRQYPRLASWIGE